ncbi:MAG TPA: hypothetical protein VK772_01770 [Puia sp.]|nr:hypothetical protein [Puia sp.]
MKMRCSGRLHESDDSWKEELCKAIGIKTNKTIKKLQKKLIEINWVSYNTNSGYYFVKSFNRLQLMLDLKKRRAVKMNYGDLGNFKAFATGALVSINIKHQKYASFLNKKKRKRFASHKADEARTNLFRPFGEDYFGISNKKIGRLIGYGQTQGCNLKNQAEKAGYIITKEKFRLLTKLNKPDMGVMRGLKISLGPRANRIKCFKRNKESTEILVVYQMYDEIKTQMKFRDRKTVRLAPRRTQKTTVYRYNINNTSI